MRDFTSLLSTLADNPWYTPAGAVLSLNGKAFNVSGLALGHFEARYSPDDDAAWRIGNGAGNIINAGGWPSLLIGGKGNDNLFDLGGKAIMLGGQGRDTFTIVGTKTGAVSNTLLDLGRGDDLVINFQENMTSKDYAQAVKAYEKTFAGKVATLSFFFSTEETKFAGSRFGETITAYSLNGDVAVFFDGGGGNDALYGSAAADVLRGGDGDDLLWGGDGADTLRGGAGADVFVYAKGVVIEDASAEDTIIVTENGVRSDKSWGAAKVIYELANGTVKNETLRGGAFDDRFTVNEASTTVDLRNGGADTVEIRVAGVSILGLGKDDTLVVTDPEARSAIIARYGVSGAKIEFVLGVPGAEFGAPRLDGWKFNDRLLGAERNDTMFGYGGDDLLDGVDGDDSLLGGDGNDGLLGGLGRDTLVGGDGNDTLLGEAGDDRLEGGADSDLIEGGAGNDQLFGGSADPKATAGEAGLPADRDTLSGGSGDDRLTAGPGATVMLGGAGSDSLIGGAGNDTLAGGEGIDFLRGGAGSDRFVFNPGETGRDTITDFRRGEDVIDLRGFTFIDGFDARTFADGVRFDSRSGVFTVDANGDGTDDLSVLIASLKGQTVADVTALYML